MQLQSVSESSLDASCIIYADSENNSGEVITAKIAKTDYNILYHNADGSVSSKISSDDIVDGSITFSADDIPDNGYVSLEEVEGLISGSPNIYMFSVEKSLLSDLVINIRQTQDSGNSCYAGTDYRETDNTSSTAVLSVNVDGLEYYQTSYDADSVDGNTSVLKIPVKSPAAPEHDTLVTGFSSYESDTGKKSNLSYFAFAESSYVYNSSSTTGIDLVLLSSADKDLAWSYDSDYSTLTFTENSMYAIHDNIIYFWQPLYSDSDFTIADSTTDITNWSGYFSGSEYNSWDFEEFIAITSTSANAIDKSLPELYDVSTIDIASNCVSSDFCIDTNDSFRSDDFLYQRTHVRMTDTADNTIYQSTYAPASESPIILDNSNNELDIQSVTKVEINLVQSDASISNAVKYLMADSMDKVSIADDAGTINDFNDANGYIATSAEQDALELAIFKSSTLTVKNSK